MKFALASILFFTTALAVAKLDPNELKGKETDSIGKSVASKEYSRIMRWALPMSLRSSSLESDVRGRENEIFANSLIRSGKSPNKRAKSSPEKSGN